MNRLFIAMALACTCMLATSFLTAPSSMVIIVNNENPVSTLSSREAKLYFLRKAPKKLATDAEIIEFVKHDVGGIGFISAESLTPEVRSSVKVVLEY